ncbi:MAG: hypothetical protein WA896_20500 [Spirulinaceae cyanobacterium]
MPEVQQGHTFDEDEISLIDILRFFKDNWLFLAVTTLGLSTLATTISLLQPKEYQKKLTLQIQPNPVAIASLTQLDINQAGQLATTLLQNQKLDQVSLKPQYDTATQQINVTLESANSQALDNISEKLTSELETSFQPEIQNDIEQSLDSVELQLNKNQQILEQIERQITQSSPEDTAKLEALETQRASRIVSNTDLEFDQQYLKEIEDNLTEFTKKALSIQIISQSEAEQTSSLLQVAILSIIASFMVAVLAAIIRNQIPYIRAELAQQEIKTKN